MDDMTNEQYKSILMMIIQILKDNGVSENVIKKIEALLPKE